MTSGTHLPLFLRAALLAILVVCWEVPLHAENVGSKTILQYSRQQVETTQSNSLQEVQIDPAVLAAKFDSPLQKTMSEPTVIQTSPTAIETRQLAAPSKSSLLQIGNGTVKPEHDSHTLGVLQLESLTTAGAGLAIVLGLFLACMWLTRKSGPKPTTLLPKDAVAVLGRVPLAARNFAQLLQVGNKIVLVAITPDGVTPLSEVTDPAEVQRLLGLCMRNRKHSTTAEFQHVLDKLGHEPAHGFLGDQAEAVYSPTRR